VRARGGGGGGGGVGRVDGLNMFQALSVPLLVVRTSIKDR
jgi:hypothetical protein